MDDYEAMIQSLEKLAESYYEGDVDEEENPLGVEPELLHYDLNPYRTEPDEVKDTGSVPLGGGINETLPEYITESDIDKYSSILYPEEKLLRSLVLEVFTPEQLLHLEKLSRNYTISNNQKVEMIKTWLNDWGFNYVPLGPGTNRYGIMCDGYVIKIALDSDGKIDNEREFIYSIPLQPYVIKCYEVSPDGLVGVFEYIEVFTLDDLYKNQTRMRDILRDIATSFLIGDVGISTVNYLNWGYRNGTDPVILDYAYIYSVKFKTFTCNCSPSAFLHYDNDFNNLICPFCGKKYTFKDIRRKISRKDQEEEIGDITTKGYVISSSEEIVKFNSNFTEGAREKILKKLLKIKKKQDKKDKEAASTQKIGPEGALSDEELLQAIASGKLMD